MPSIWKEEVYRGFINEIKSSVKYKDQLGNLTNIPLVLVRKPEEEFKPEMYPCVSVYNTMDTYSSVRYNPNPIMKELVGNTATMQESKIPFDMSIQIDFWARYQEDMDIMTKTWLKNHFRQFNLNVVDDNGNETTCNCIKKASLRKSDLLSGGERLFHSIIPYVVWVEIDPESEYTVNVASKIDVNTNQN